MIDDPNVIRNALVPFPARTQTAPQFIDRDALTRSEALNNYLPIQNLSEGMALYTDGENASWQPINTSTATTITGFLVGVNGLIVGVSSNEIDFGTITTGTWNGATIEVAYGGIGITSGTSGGVLAFTGSTTIASSAALTANVPMIGGGAGSVPTVATGLLYASGGPHLTITAQNAAYVPLVVKGFASQSANLQEWRNSAGTIVSRINSAGAFVGGLVSTGLRVLDTAGNTYVEIGPEDANPNGLRIHYPSPGSSNILAMGLTYDGNARIQCEGSISIEGSSVLLTSSVFLAKTTISASASSDIGLIVKGAASQSANLQEWQSSTGTIEGFFSTDLVLSGMDAGYLAVGSSAARHYRIGSYDAAGSMVFARSDSANGLLFTPNSDHVAVGPVNGSIVISQASGSMALTPCGGGGSSAVQVGRRFSDSNAACGASLECWPSTGQTTPALSTVIPGGGTYVFKVGLHGDISTTLQNASVVGLTVKGATSQTANLQEWQDSAGTNYVFVGPPTLSGASITSNFFNITGTLPSSNTTSANGVRIVVASAGSSSFAQTAMIANLGVGYTGSAGTYGINSLNTAAGTGTNWTSAIANLGVFARAGATTAGYNIGIKSFAFNSSVLNVAISGGSVNSSGSSTVNIGVVGQAVNGSTVNVGGHFSLTSAQPTFQSAALVADNGAVAAPIFLAMDNGTEVMRIADGGLVGIGITPTAQLHVVSSGAAVVGLTVKGAASQSANLQEWQNSAGAVLAKVDSIGCLILGGNQPMNEAIFSLVSENGRVCGVNFDSANNLNWGKASNGSFSQNFFSSSSTINMVMSIAGTEVRCLTNATVGLIVAGTTSQSANLQEWKNIAGTVLLDITSSGGIHSPGDINFSSSSGVVNVSCGFFAQQGIRGWNANQYGFAVSGDVVDTSGLKSLVAGTIKVTNGSSGFGSLSLGAYSSSTVGLTVTGAASQSADFFKIKDSAGTDIFQFDASGAFYVNGPTGLPGYGKVFAGFGCFNEITNVSNTSPYITLSSSFMRINARNATDTVLIVKGAASHSANLQEWQDSTGTVLAWVRHDGVSKFSNVYASEFNDVNGNRLRLLMETDGTHAGTFINANASFVPLSVKGAASQSANLQEWQNSAGTSLASVSSTGVIGNSISLGTTDFTVFSTNTAFNRTVGFFWNAGGTEGGVRGTSNLYLAAVNAIVLSPNGATAGFGLVASNTGAIEANEIVLTNNIGRVTFYPSLANKVALTVRGNTSQSANLQEWQNSAGTVLASINSAGIITVPNIVATNYSISPTLYADNIYSNTASRLSYINMVNGVKVLSNAATDIGLTVRGIATKTKTINNVALTSNVATLTTSAAHGFFVGETVVITGLTNTALNGTYTITVVGSTTTFSFAKTNANITSVSDSGTVVVSQTANLQEWQNGAGSVLASLNSTGQLLLLPDSFAIGGGSHGTLGTTAIAIGKNATATDDGPTELSAIAIGLGASSAGKSVAIGASASVSASGGVAVGNGATSAGTGVAIGISTSSGSGAVAIGNSSSVGTNGVSIGRATIGSGSGVSIGYSAAASTGEVAFSARASVGGLNLVLQGPSSTTNARVLGYVSSAWIDSTDASRTGRLTLSSNYISTAQEGIRIDSASDTARVAIGGAIISGVSTTIYSKAAADKALVVLGAASQSANLQEWQNSAGTALTVVNSDGRLGVGTSAIGIVNGNTFTSVRGHFKGTGGSAYILVDDSNTCGVLLSDSSQAADSRIWSLLNQTTRFSISSVSDAGTPTERISVTRAGLTGINKSSSIGGQFHVQSSSAGTVTGVFQGAVSQTANLQEWQNNSGTAVAGITNNGDIFSYNQSGANTSIRVGHSSSNSSVISAWLNNSTQTIGLAFNVTGQYGGGTSGTNGRNFSFYDYVSSAYRFGVGPEGNFYYGSSDTSYSVMIKPSAAATVPLTVKGAASQSANLTEWQNSAGTVLASINSVGGAIFRGLTATDATLGYANVRTSASSNSRLIIDGGTTTTTSQIDNATGVFRLLSTSYIMLSLDNITNGRAGFFDGLATNVAVNIPIQNAAHVGVVVKGATSQSANLQEWQNSSGTVLAKVSASGNFTAAGTIRSDDNYLLFNSSGSQVISRANTEIIMLDNVYWQTFTIRTNSTNRFQIGSTGNVLINGFTNSTVGLTVKGAASQSANLQEWQNSSGTVVAYIGPSGTARFASTVEIGTAAPGTFFGALNVGGTIVTNQGAIAVANSAGTKVGGFTSVGVCYADSTFYFSQATGSETGTIKIGSTGRNANNPTGTSLTIISNGAQSGQTNQNAGDLNLSTGISTGTGTSKIVLKVAPIGSSGSTDNTPAEVLMLSQTTQTALLTVPAAALVGLVVKGAPSQSANLQEWQNSAGTVLTKVTSAGHIIEDVDTGEIGIKISGSFSNARTWLGEANHYIYAAAGTATQFGNYYGANFIQTGGAPGPPCLQATVSIASTIGLVVKGAVSQSANLQEWQNSVGTVRSGVNSDGSIFVGNAYNDSGSGHGGGYCMTLDNVAGGSMRPLFITSNNVDASIDFKNTSAGGGHFNFGSCGSGGGAGQGFVVYDVTNGRCAFGIRGANSLVNINGTTSLNAQLGVTNVAAANAVIIAKGAASQTGSLQEWQNSSGTVLANINASGIPYFKNGDGSSVRIEKSTTNGATKFLNSCNGGFSFENDFLAAKCPVTSLKFIVDTASSTIAGFFGAGALLASNYQYGFLSGSGTNIGGTTTPDAGIACGGAGIVKITNGSSSFGSLELGAYSSSTVALTVTGAPSQSANLQEWQNSSGAIKAKIDSVGGGAFSGELQVLDGSGSIKMRNTNNNSAVVLASEWKLNWSDTGDAFYATPDIGLARSAAGVLKVTNGSSGLGDLELGKLISFSANIKVETGTSYTLLAGDTGKIVEFTNGSAITVTLPDDLDPGFTVTIVQVGGGQIEFVVDGGASLLNARSHNKTYGQDACASLYVTTNVGGTAATYRLSGDTAS